MVFNLLWVRNAFRELMKTADRISRKVQNIRGFSLVISRYPWFQSLSSLGKISCIAVGDRVSLSGELESYLRGLDLNTPNAQELILGAL